FVRVLQQMQHLVDARGPLAVAQDHRVFETLVVAFGIDQAELIARFAQPLQYSDRRGRLAAPRGAGDEHSATVRMQMEGRAVSPLAEQDVVASEPALIA